MSVGLAVEHVIPKSRDPAKETSWNNFLLGCTNCNSNKGKKPTNETDFLWPDRDNTLRAFTYSKGGFVDAATGLPTAATTQSRRLMEVVGLNRHVGLPSGLRPAKRDSRWRDREETWKLAERLLEHYEAGRDRQLVLEGILDGVRRGGFFSVWMTVFASKRDIRKALIKALPGTAADCFDRQYRSIARPGGRL